MSLLCHRKTHELKISAKTFNDLKLDALRFMIVDEDEKYRIGDRILFVEMGDNGFPTGEMLKRQIIYLLHGEGSPMLQDFALVLGLQKGA